MVRAFEDRLWADRSPAMVRRVMGVLGSILADTQERGLVAQNVVRSLRGSRRRDKDRHADKRQKGKLKVGVDIPTPDEIRAIIAHLNGPRPILLTAIFTGLHWTNACPNHQTSMHHRQRAPHHAMGKRAQHPFGTIKARMGATHFLTKTLPRVATEMALHVLGYNLTRVMNIFGVRPLMAAMRT
jgi:hypothetical protein